MAATFHIESHTFPGQHIREHPRALASSQEDPITLHAKSYTPHAVANGSARGDMTIIAFHANAFHKEVYEPFFEALHHHLRTTHNLTIGSIWIADQAAQGTSGLLNDGISGNDPSWLDHARDVLAMTNTFRARMKRPIVGIGHSMGGTQAVATAHLHPRLFEAVALVDAVVSKTHSQSARQMLRYALSRPEAHESREQAEEAVRRSPVFQGWDERVVRRFVETGFHEAPTATRPDGRVKPTTSKHAEASTLVRSQIRHPTHEEEDVDVSMGLGEPSTSPETPPDAQSITTVPMLAYSWLPSLRPSILFLDGKGSRVCRPEEVVARANITGTAPGGSGGRAVGRVSQRTIQGGHFAPMTNVDGTAAAVAQWLSEEMERIRRWEGNAVAAGDWAAQEIGKKQRVGPAVQKAWRRWEGQGEGPKSRL